MYIFLVWSAGVNTYFFNQFFRRSTYVTGVTSLSSDVSFTQTHSRVLVTGGISDRPNHTAVTGCNTGQEKIKRRLQQT